MAATIEKNKEKKEWTISRPECYLASTAHEMSICNQKSLTETITYLKKLNNQHIINDLQFKETIVWICTKYIENEVEARVSRKLTEKVFHLFDKV